MRHVTKLILKESHDNAVILATITVLMLLIVGFDVIAPWPFKILIDNVLSNEAAADSSLPHFLSVLFPSNYALGFFAIFIYFSSTFLHALVEYAKSVLTKIATKRFTANFAEQAFESLQSIAIGYFSKQKIGDYIYRLSYDTSALGEFIEQGFLPLFTSGLYLCITITIMLLISVQLTLISLASLPFLTLGMYYFNSRIQTATKRSERYNSAAFAFVEEAMTHLKIIQAFSQERKESEAFNRRIETSLTSEVSVARLDFLLSLLVGILIAVSYSIVLLYGMHSVLSGSLTTGLLIVFVLYLDNLTNPIINIIYAVTAGQQAWVKIMRMEEFFSPRTHIPYHTGTTRSTRTYDARFEQVSLTIGGKKILDNVSFHIEAGKRTVIFGVSGSGKTTILNLLMRFIDKPSAGRIYIGPTPLEEYDITALRDAISYVPQEITLFNDSIRNNILFGHPANEKRMVYSAKLAGAHEFVQSLPGKYDFRVGELGGYLSGGQRQRLMLARALMKEHAKLYVFDETFSALDVKTRHEVLKNIYSSTRGKTVFIISNIFDVIKGADNIIVLNQGKVIYSGPSERLPKEISLERMMAQSEPDIESS